MQVVLHIGMGKTGTSSIQESLLRNSERLSQRGIAYLGLWFDLITPRFYGYDGQADFFSSSTSEYVELAEVFAARLKELSAKHGWNKFILSNEDMYGHVEKIAPFIEAVRRHVDVMIICYVRDPAEWLPSAYTQWSTVHKTYEGPIRSYSDFARELVKTYHGFIVWHRLFGDILTVRKFDKDKNVVEDFSDFIGFEMLGDDRALERITDEEAIFRIVYNNRFMGSVFPSLFNSSFRNMDFRGNLSLGDIVSQFMDFRETEIILDEYSHLPRFIEEKFGIKFKPPARGAYIKPNLDDIRSRMLDHLLRVVVDQSDRIRDLEAAVARLSPGHAEEQ